ncbi:MAG: hypothetical protein E7397_01985 [Ruminococcaceae bacterium]|nr:hypothetical protein [Oscillospiraceae bacterium]
MWKTNKTEEQLFNRILINFGIGILAYWLLYYLYGSLYMANGVTFTLAAIFLVAGIVCIALGKKLPLKNYGIMFVAFCLCLLFTRLSVLTSIVIGIENFLSLQEGYVFKKLMQTSTQVTILGWAGSLYLLGMFVYNCILIKNVRLAKRSKNKKSK